MQLGTNDVTGESVRKMQLGHLTTGSCRQTERAISWDGKTKGMRMYHQAPTSIKFKLVATQRPEGWESGSKLAVDILIKIAIWPI